MKRYQDTYAFDDRVHECQRIMEKFPHRTPVIVQRAPACTLPFVEPYKMLAPDDLTVGQLLYVMRRRIKLSPETALFFFVRGQVPNSSDLLTLVHHQHHDPDGFLYIDYAEENTFGAF